MEPFDIAGVEAPTIVRANDDKIDNINDNNDGIMFIATIPQANNPDPLILSDKSVDNNANDIDDKWSNDDSLQGGNPGIHGDVGVDKPEEDQTEGKDQGVRQSKRMKKGTTGNYKDFGLMMNAQQQARGGQHQAIIRNSLVFFLAEDLSDTKPVAEEDREEWGTVLVHYFMGALIKKFQERSKGGVTNELTQMHNMDMF